MTCRDHSRARVAQSAAGFTLIEIVAAVAILSVGLMVLIEGHYNTLQLFESARDDATVQILYDTAVNAAEIGVSIGQLTGEGDFGKRFEGYAYSYTATQSSDYGGLYAVDVTVSTPSGDNIVSSMTYKNVIK